jgi:hypothetical protein
MTVKLQGNRAGYFRGGSDGIGGRSMPDGTIGWVGMVNSAAGDVIYLSASEVHSNNHPYLAYSMQVVGGDATVEFTLQNLGTSISNETGAAAAWCNSTTVAPGTLTTIVYGFAAIKITFPTKGCEFYIVAR